MMPLPDLPNLMIRIGDKMRIELDPIPITPRYS